MTERDQVKVFMHIVWTVAIVATISICWWFATYLPIGD